MRELALFAGGGGSLLAGKLLGWVPVCAVELDPYCRRILLARQRDGVLPRFPVWDDVQTFRGELWRGHVDVITAGFPCQPWSLAGKQAGEQDSRNLWPDTIRVVCQVRPNYLFMENVPALLAQRYMGHIFGSLAEAGYDARWCVLGADDIGAPHHRKRLWILAYPTGNLRRASRDTRSQTFDRGSPAVGDSRRMGLSQPKHQWQHAGSITESSGWPTQSHMGGMVDELAPRMDKPWSHEPADVPRVATGIPERVGRLQALGNGWVPLAAARAWHILTAGLEETRSCCAPASGHERENSDGEHRA